MCSSWLNIEREALAAALHQVMRNVACYAAWANAQRKSARPVWWALRGGLDQWVTASASGCTKMCSMREWSM